MTDNTYTYIQFAQGACWMHMCMYWMYPVCIYFQCICAVCMYLYVSVCIYVYTYNTLCVLYLCCMYRMYWPRQALMPSQHPPKTPSWGSTLQAPLRSTLSSSQTTFFSHRWPTPGPGLAHPRAQHALGGGKASPWRHQWSPPTLFAYGDLASSPIRADLGGLFRAAGSWAAAAPPANPHLTLFEGGEYVYVYVCMCMYGIYLYV
jgi:hypothetical protein